MRDFFSLEGSFNKYAGFLADTVILSFIWIFFSLPIITIGASTTALFYVSTRRIANREGYLTSDFWQSFKANFKRATLLWLIIFAIGFLVIWNMLLAFQNPDMMGRFSSLVIPVQIVVLIELAFVTTYIFPVTARFDMGFKETLKSCFFMANRHFLTSLTCTLIFVGLFVAALEFFPPLIFISPGIYAMLSSHMLMRVFKKYRPEMDKDPILELQEIEAAKAEARRRAEIGFTQPDENIIIEESSDKNLT
ncbi:MAG: DUF624 domain-containing protein [Defluviitaleaceae bacterium]|nr:DUF624 domain-containing protein [Defluviitaleaceae bacterium]